MTLRDLFVKATGGEWGDVGPSDNRNTYLGNPTDGLFVGRIVNSPDFRLIVALHNCANELLKVAECSEGIVTLSRPYRLNDEGCRAAMEELLLKIKTLDAALRALREKESSCREER